MNAEGSNGRSPALSIVIPTYNERENARRFIPALAEHFREIDHEIIVVDDNSPDGTAAVVRELCGRYSVELLVRHDRRGFGSALCEGYDRARGEMILSIDVDGSYPPPDALRVYRALAAGQDLVVGSRHSAGSLFAAPTLELKMRRFSSAWENRLIRWLTGIPLHDFTANCRAIRRSLWESLALEEASSFLLIAMVLLGARRGARIAEVPVTFAERPHGRTKINHFVEIPRAFVRTIRYVLEHRSGL
ncbi:MAG: glycosyltransferase [Candidatus Sungbacteria bacterium]|uniref:Glycosyltransferase n=1 Tax=Candidatus Sungiibacteriota bacterium TaxID=2750080 RepID=A0A933DSY8_9BACT|nr:glycosyltransferase [Candidatus Sungbacteria bacterium]